MPSNVNYVVAENVLGFIGTVFWSFQLLPQVWKNFKAKSTHGLSSLMMYSWALSAISYLPYTIVAGLAIPLIIQPILFGVIALCCHAQCKFYDSGWSRFGCIVWFAVNVLIMAAVAAICVVVIQTFATPFNIIWPLNTLGALGKREMEGGEKERVLSSHIPFQPSLFYFLAFFPSFTKFIH